MVRVAHRRWRRRDDATPILYHCSHVQSLFRSFLPDSIRLLDLEVVEYFAACTAGCARLARTSIDRYCCVERESWRGLGARRVKFSWNFSDILGKFPSVRRQLFVSQTKLAGRDSSPVERTTTSFHLATNSPWLLFKIEFRVCDSRKSPSDYFREYAELRLAAVRWPVSTKFRLSKSRFSRSVV